MLLAFGAFAFAVTPALAQVVSSFTPSAGTVGTQVTITGSGFTGATAVSFGGGQASSFTVNSDTQITASVPASAATGPISVTTPGGTGSSLSSFTVNPGIAVSPRTGPPTKIVTVRGAGFGPFEAVDVYFDGTAMTVASASSTGNFSISIQVPASATPGSHQITAVGRHSGYSGQANLIVSTPWPQFHYSATHRGFNPYENVLSPYNVGHLDENWSFTTGGAVESSPAVVNGRVFVGSDDGNLYALNATTGSKLWSFATGGAVQSSPAVADGLVYVDSAAGTLYALNAATGATVWTAGTGAVSSPLTVAGGVVYVPEVGNTTFGFVATYNAATGAPGAFDVIDPSPTSPTVFNGVAYTGAGDNLFREFGGSGWSSYITGATVNSSAALSNGRLYFGSDDDNVYAIDAAPSSGNGIWSFFTSTIGAVESSPAVAPGGAVYGIGGAVYAGADDGRLYALNALDGNELWNFSTSGGTPVHSPAVANGVVYVGADDGNVYALDVTNGNELWSFATGAAVKSSPAVVNGVVYVGSNDGNVYALGLSGGLASTIASSWRLATSFSTVQSLTVNAVSPGGRVTVSCSGTGCPFTRRTAAIRDRVASLDGLFGSTRLRPGTRIQVSIADPSGPSKTETFVIRRDAPPAELTQCVTAAGRALPNCPGAA